jgi:hypothetical protein
VGNSALRRTRHETCTERICKWKASLWCLSPSRAYGPQDLPLLGHPPPEQTARQGQGECLRTRRVLPSGLHLLRYPDDRQRQCFLNRSALTCSQGMTSPGLRWYWPRRKSSSSRWPSVRASSSASRLSHTASSKSNFSPPTGCLFHFVYCSLPPPHDFIISERAGRHVATPTSPGTKAKISSDWQQRVRG